MLSDSSRCCWAGSVAFRIAKHWWAGKLDPNNHLNRLSNSLEEFIRAWVSMASPSQIPIYQDYLVHIRYQTDQYPPDSPPKLMDMDGKAQSRVLEPTFVSKMARTDSTCVGVDSELGMPLDMAHISGIFDGDDSAIRPHKPTPPIDPRDRLLFRTPAQLGGQDARVTVGAAAASWLRRTEYVSGELSRSTFRSKPAFTTTLEKLLENNRAMRNASINDDADPLRILAAILHGFDVANPETAGISPLFFVENESSNAAEKSWKNLQHPTKPYLKVVDTFPLLPDLAAASDAGGYLIFKFATDPLVPGNTRDTRVDVGLLRLHGISDSSGDQPNPADQNFDYYLPSTATVAKRIKHKFGVYNEADCNPGEKFRYKFVRTYETKRYKKHDLDLIHEAALTFHDSRCDKLKVAYYYPVVGRYVIQPRRTHIFPPGMPLQNEEKLREQERQTAEGEAPPDILNVTVRDLNLEQRKKRRKYKH